MYILYVSKIHFSIVLENTRIFGRKSLIHVLNTFTYFVIEKYFFLIKIILFFTQRRKKPLFLIQLMRIIINDVEDSSWLDQILHFNCNF